MQFCYYGSESGLTGSLERLLNFIQFFFDVLFHNLFHCFIRLFIFNNGKGSMITMIQFKAVRNLNIVQHYCTYFGYIQKAIISFLTLKNAVIWTFVLEKTILQHFSRLGIRLWRSPPVLKIWELFLAVSCVSKSTYHYWLKKSYLVL